ncbi:MAG: hypothetical protein II047_01395 [Bacteroidales bacterium]|nr:hypothetical protein [Bacteroidales bacterium]
MSTDFTDIRYSDDFDAEMLLILSPFLATYNTEQVWATRGYVYIKSYPVFHLENGERPLIETDFRAFRLRIGTPMKLFSEEIIGSMHFSSQAMLTRYMKRTVGKTPTEYRKQVVSVP